MNEKLKLSASPFLIIVRFVFVATVIFMISAALLGFVDVRNGEQKAQDYREELLNERFAPFAIDAIKLTQKKNPQIEIKSIVVALAGPNFLVKITDTDGTKQYYDLKYNRSIDELTYEQKIAAYISGYTHKSFTREYEGNDLMILCEEAKK